MIARCCRGFSLVELLVVMTVLALMMAAALGILFQGKSTAARSESLSHIQGNVQFALGRLEQDLRIVGFGVPAGAEIGGTALWTPSIFHASSTEIGFRADIDGGRALVVCTPKSTNPTCPRTKLLLGSISYYDLLNCRRPDNPSVSLPVVVVHNRDAWESVTCSSVNVSEGSIVVSVVTNDTFLGGESDVLTIEQVYYRYVPRSQPPYGRLERYVRYANTPDNTFPPVWATWTLMADHLTDFWLEYRDGGGNVVSGSPLSAVQRAQVQRVAIFLEGFDSVGPQGISQSTQIESEIFVRNAGL